MLTNYSHFLTVRQTSILEVSFSFICLFFLLPRFCSSNQSIEMYMQILRMNGMCTLNCVLRSTEFPSDLFTFCIVTFSIQITTAKKRTSKTDYVRMLHCYIATLNYTFFFVLIEAVVNNVGNASSLIISTYRHKHKHKKRYWLDLFVVVVQSISIWNMQLTLSWNWTWFIEDFGNRLLELYYIPLPITVQRKNKI